MLKSLAMFIFGVTKSFKFLATGDNYVSVARYNTGINDVFFRIRQIQALIQISMSF